MLPDVITFTARDGIRSAPEEVSDGHGSTFSLLQEEITEDFARLNHLSADVEEEMQDVKNGTESAELRDSPGSSRSS